VLPKACLTILVAGAILLPIAITLVAATAFLFNGLQDLGMARVLNGVAIGLGLLWTLDLAALTVVLGIDALMRAGGERDVDEE